MSSSNIAGKKKRKIVYGYGIIPPLPVLRNERYAILKFRLREYAERPRTDRGNTLWQMYTPSKSRINAEERAIGGCA